MDENRQHSPDDISLKSIKDLLLNIVHGTFIFFDSLLRLIRRRFAYFIILPLLGAALGYLKYRISPKRYEQSMIVECNDLSKRTYYEMFQQLDKLCKMKSKVELARELNMTEADAQYVKSIELMNIDGTSLENDTSSRLRQPLKVVVLVSDPKVTNEHLQNAIINSINGNSYLANKKEVKKAVYLAKLKFIDSELAKLDSLKVEYTKSLNSSKMSPTFYNNAFNPAEVFVQSNNLVNQKEDITMWLVEQLKPVNVIDGFRRNDRPKSLGMLASIFYGFLIGLLISIFIVTIKELRSVVFK